MTRRCIGASLAVALAGLAAPAGRALAGESARRGPTAAEFARLQQEVAAQRQLLLQILQVEQQRTDMLLKLLQGGAPLPPGALAPLPALPGAPPTPGPVPATVPPLPAAAAAAASVARDAGDAGRHGGGSAAISGRVSGGSGDVWVYVENDKGAPARGRTLEIKQQGRQFSPQVAVVQRGTTVAFPNLDAVYHNVFSPSPGNTFDLGSYRAGDKPGRATLTTPGVVDVFCNIHSKMSAKVLVLPGPHYAKVGGDGRYRIEGVPLGPRKLVAWSARSKPALQKIDLGSGGAEVDFTLESAEDRAHNNKLGQPYGSYKE